MENVDFMFKMKIFLKRQEIKVIIITVLRASTRASCIVPHCRSEQSSKNTWPIC